MTEPAPVPPPAAQPRKTRWWLVAIVAAWAVGLTGAALWSVRHDPPTVAEQRDIAGALPALRQASGAVVAAADGPDRAVEIGPLRFDAECALTPVRSGVEARQEITVRVRSDQAPGALESIARALPEEYAPALRHLDDNSRHVLRADAGDFVAVDATAASDAPVFSLWISTGCRPAASGVDLAPAPRPATTTPPAFAAATKAVGATGPVTAVEVACPNGKTAGTVTATGPALPGDLGRALRDVVGGGLVVQAEPHGWAYRAGDVSVFVTAADGATRVSATSGCRQGLR
ncbi:hypothetical protein [Couchioplanes azureus]|uniref:hypothetical protein n=1 Tax=Couchioplanes caeruleus TaxID=56438 RepID=UPI00166F8229|nr:hypothetical protein [Couchioplanes caeruleus]